VLRYWLETPLTTVRIQLLRTFPRIAGPAALDSLDNARHSARAEGNSKLIQSLSSGITLLGLCHADHPERAVLGNADSADSGLLRFSDRTSAIFHRLRPHLAQRNPKSKAAALRWALDHGVSGTICIYLFANKA